CCTARGAEGGIHARQPGAIATGTREACDEPGPHRVAKWKHDYWDRAGCVLHGFGGWRRGDNDDIRLECEGVGREGGESVPLAICREVVDLDCLSMPVAEIMQPLEERAKSGRL